MAAASDDRIVEYAQYELNMDRAFLITIQSREECVAEGCFCHLRFGRDGDGRMTAKCWNERCTVEVLDWHKGLWYLPDRGKALNCRLCGEWLDIQGTNGALNVMDHMEEKHAIGKRQMYPAIMPGPSGKERQQCPFCKKYTLQFEGKVKCRNEWCKSHSGKNNGWFRVETHMGVTYVHSDDWMVNCVICQFCGDCVDNKEEELFDHILREHTFEGLKMAVGKRVRMVRPDEVPSLLESTDAKQTGRLTKAAAPT